MLQVLIKCKTICEDSLVPSMAVLTRGEMGPAFVEAVSAHDCDFAVVGLSLLSLFPDACNDIVMLLCRQAQRDCWLCRAGR